MAIDLGEMMVKDPGLKQAALNNPIFSTLSAKAAGSPFGHWRQSGRMIYHQST
jgi:hypothetical protein